MKCSVCGTASEGRFCPECGAPMREGLCRSCEAPLGAGARFCTQCGEAVHLPPSKLPWAIAGLALAALALVLLLPTLRGGSAGALPPFASPMAPVPGAQAGGGPPAGGAPGGAAPPALSDDPRTNADRLFNRIMNERSAGNLEQARFFMPMALQAYQMAEPLDDDGLFHVALLQSADGKYDDARATAERILAGNADHLLALAAAGEAMAAKGDTAAARDYYSRFLAAYDREKEKVYPEYLDHAAIFPEYERAARALVNP
jgi:tetratricopeptide (TPR) repeat protein